MVKSVIIVGAGQLGSRYLQGLSAVTAQLNIYVQDISLESLDRARLRWEEVITERSIHEVFFLQNFEKLPESIDLAIVSTAANIRANVVESLSKVSKVNYWILEKVLAQSSAEIDRLRSVISKSEGAWVNTSRRMMKWHKEIKSKINTSSPISLQVLGNNWGLASNSVHFLDMISWWTGETLTELDTTELEDLWFESKRPGYFEVFGTIIAKFSLGSVARLTSTDTSIPLKIAAVVDGLNWAIDEIAGHASREDGLVINGEITVQSKLSSILVNSIGNGTCELPTFEDSAFLHTIFLNALQIHWDAQLDKQEGILPVT